MKTMNDFISNIMIDNGVLIIVNSEGQRPPKCVDIHFDGETHEKLDKLIGTEYDLTNFGVNIVEYGCSYNNKLYKIINTDNKFLEDYLFSLEFIEYCFKKEGFDFNKFKKFYDNIENKNLEDIVCFIRRSKENNNNFKEYFNENDIKILNEYCKNIKDAEIELFKKIENEDLNYIDDYFFEKNKISYGYCTKFDGLVSNLYQLKDNELINGNCGSLKFWINGYGYASISNKFGFPNEENGVEFDNIYLEHFKNVIIPVLHKIFKQEGLE